MGDPVLAGPTNEIQAQSGRLASHAGATIGCVISTATLLYLVWSRPLWPLRANILSPDSSYRLPWSCHVGSIDKIESGVKLHVQQV